MVSTEVTFCHSAEDGFHAEVMSVPRNYWLYYSTIQWEKDYLYSLSFGIAHDLPLSAPPYPPYCLSVKIERLMKMGLDGGEGRPKRRGEGEMGAEFYSARCLDSSLIECPHITAAEQRGLL
jgi:hypothetical protein